MAVSGRVKVLLTIENVLKRVSEYDIYKFYLGREFALGVATYSPFRKESNPSFSIIKGNNGKLRHLDYADTQNSGDVINFVCQLYHITPSQALLKIDHDFNLGITSPSESVKSMDFKRIESKPHLDEEKKKSIIQVVSRRFDPTELIYWKSYHLNERILRDNDVYAVKTLYLDRKRYPLRGDLCFAYLFMVDGDAKWKIYWPERKKHEKWLSNVPNSRMSGMERIKKGDSHVIITKAKKDEMVLSLFLPHVVSVQSESIYAISQENLAILQTCPNSFINFDNDETGVKASQYFNQFGLGWINCPKGFKEPKKGKEIKDFADLGRYYGIDTVKAYFRKQHIPITI